ncbi:MAG: SDR family NAD(P)-dependent oxidoreductase [Solirubrobacterales bacterium]|nr:SDR family NAD(P)-dependent oxidoreductase [Solirubrobacterales bacterium]
MDLEGRIALVTGASSGIGVAVADQLAREGADVALLARSRPGLEKVAARVRAHGRRALVVPADVTDRAAVDAAVRRVVDELGGLDVLVSGHAAVVFGRFEDVAPEDFDRTVDVTFTGAVNVIRAALPALAQRRGTIVAIGSIMTKVPLPTFSSYASAKHALRGFLSSLRMELKAAGDPVRLSTVNPGAVDTPLWDNTTTATGRAPHKPPDSYSPEAVAKVVVACAKHPRSEITVGGEARLVELAWTFARPVGEQILGIAERLYSSGRTPYDRPGRLWDATSTGEARDGMHGRPSLWAPIRLALDAPLRLLSRD